MNWENWWTCFLCFFLYLNIKIKTKCLLFQLRTYDNNDNSLSSVADIIINIIDVNDNRPIFPQAVYNATIPENSTVGTFVKRIRVGQIYASSCLKLLLRKNY